MKECNTVGDYEIRLEHKRNGMKTLVSEGIPRTQENDLLPQIFGYRLMVCTCNVDPTEKQKVLKIPLEKGHLYQHGPDFEQKL